MNYSPLAAAGQTCLALGGPTWNLAVAPEKQKYLLYFIPALSPT